MKAHLLSYTLIFVLLISASQSFAGKGIVVEAKVTYADGTVKTQEVRLEKTMMVSAPERIDAVQLQRKGFFLLDDQNKKVFYGPDQVKRLEFKIKDRTFVYNSFEWGDEQLLLRTKIDGKLQLIWEYFYGGGEMQCKEIMQFADRDTGVRFAVAGFVDRAKEYLADCPEMVAALDDGQFKFKNREEMVEFYNANCE